MDNEIKDILVKKEGWKEFITPVHKKIIPVILPSMALGFVFYNIADFFVQKGIMGDIQSKLFLIAVVFLYLWFLLQLFMLSCWIYTIIESRIKKYDNIMPGLKMMKYGKKME